MTSTTDDCNPVVEFYAALGVPMLRPTIAEGRVMDVITPDDAALYSKIAAFNVSGIPMRSPEGDDLVPNLGLHMIQCITHAVASDTEIIEQDAEGVTMKTPDGPLRVTEQSLRHWEWILTLLSDTGAAAAFLEQVPESARREAEARVAEVWTTSFSDLAGEVEGGASQ